MCSNHANHLRLNSQHWEKYIRSLNNENIYYLQIDKQKDIYMSSKIMRIMKSILHTNREPQLWKSKALWKSFTCHFVTIEIQFCIYEKSSLKWKMDHVKGPQYKFKIWVSTMAKKLLLGANGNSIDCHSPWF